MFRLNLIKKFQELGYTIYAIAPYDEYAIKLQEQNIKYISVEMDNDGTNPVKDLKLLKDLFFIYNDIAPSVIFHFTIKPNIYGSIAARLLNIPVINNITGLGTVYLEESFLQSLTNYLYKFAFLRVEKVFFQNYEDKKIFLDKKIIDEMKADIIPGSGVNIEHFSPREKTKVPPVKVFLLIARVIRDKGILEFVEAADNLKKKYKNIEFQILGQLGALNKGAIPEREVRMWCERNTITYLGTNDDVREFIANADCVVLPSYREGTSKVLLEAASMAKPIIATDVPGCNNVITDGENGFLCKPRSSEDLEKKIEKMLKLSDQERKMMGFKGRKKVIGCFDETIVIQKYIKTVEALKMHNNI